MKEETLDTVSDLSYISVTVEDTKVAALHGFSLFSSGHLVAQHSTPMINVTLTLRTPKARAKGGI